MSSIFEAILRNSERLKEEARERHAVTTSGKGLSGLTALRKTSQVAPGPSEVPAARTGLAAIAGTKREEETETKARLLPPSESADILRVLALAKVDPFDVPDLTAELKTAIGTMRLDALSRDGSRVQSACLQAARNMGGLLAPVGVGFGKSIISYLLPTVLSATAPLLVVPAHLVIKTRREIRQLSQHWKINPNLMVISYHAIQNPKTPTLLEDVGPDLIVLDEGHHMRNRDSTRVGRFLRFCKAHPEVKVCVLSGTLTLRSLLDYFHLARLALRNASPLPLTATATRQWDEVFGSVKERKQAHILASLDKGPKPLTVQERRHIVSKFERWAGRLYDNPRDAFRDRLVSAPGVVATSSSAANASLTVMRVLADIPEVVQTAIDKLSNKGPDGWTRPDGEELTTALEKAACERQILSGFYYRWAWPGGVVDKEWMGARSMWHKELRKWLLEHARDMLDSPLLVSHACIKRNSKVAELWDAWDGWAKVKHRPAPPVETVWLDTYLVDDAVKRAAKDPMIIWYSTRAVGEELGKRGIPVYEAGDRASKALIDFADAVYDGRKKATSIACSIQSHGTGKNLQGWNEALMFEVPSTGTTWEQTVGRLHRAGQMADEVTYRWYGHHDCNVAAMRGAQADARYQAETTGETRTLVFAQYIDESDCKGS